MMSQKKLLDKLKERIRIWNITFLFTSALTIGCLIMTSYFEITKIPNVQTATTILLMLFSIPMGVSMGLQVAKNLVKQWKEDT